MASRGQRLEFTEGREIVYCHNCRNEWYKDGHEPSNLSCPRCGLECVEIVTPESDPRVESINPLDFGRGARFLFSPHQHHHLHHHHDSDSDQEENHIEEHHYHGPGGLFGQRMIHRSPESSPYSRRTRVGPGSSDDIIRRFTEMLGEMSGPNMVGRSGPETLFNDDRGSGPRVTYQTFTAPGIAGGVSTFTITTATRPGMGRPRGPPVETHMGGDDPFQRIFGELLAIGPPPGLRRDDPSARDPSPGNENGGGGNRPLDIATALNQLLATLINPNAIHGDAVYTQEALDRIITNLMEANPQSNAPAPATENAIASLPKKKLDAEMLGPELKGECTICIDEVKVGDEVVVLPCRHWFHEECASLWLKQHNSCPVCRAAIDGAAAGKPRSETSSAQSSSQAAEASSSSRQSAAERRRTQLRQRGEERLDSIRSVGNPFDRSRDRRRDSNSPPSHDHSTHRSSGIRSPSPPSRASTHSERSRDNRGSSGGAFNWLRDRFSGR
ncbi:hypothetical protein GGR51DRAFT_383201 [Nemania sp. FL0031]|nr:hypothetical protein GGR51DRAFT_383201 [Nemania sp. FL0031]